MIKWDILKTIDIDTVRSVSDDKIYVADDIPSDLNPEYRQYVEVWSNQKRIDFQTYNPKIICNFYKENSKIIKHFGNVYTMLCENLGVSFKFENATVTVPENNHEFCDYVRYVTSYVSESGNINRKLLENNQQQLKKAQPLIKVMKAYNITYASSKPPQGIRTYNIFHVGQMMYDDDKNPCVSYETESLFFTRCFLSCSLTILQPWLEGDKLKVIYEIKVDIKQPVFFLFDNTEQMECLLPPNTPLKYIAHKFITYMNAYCLLVNMELG